MAVNHSARWVLISTKCSSRSAKDLTKLQSDKTGLATTGQPLVTDVVEIAAILTLVVSLETFFRTSTSLASYPRQNKKVCGYPCGNLQAINEAVQGRSTKEADSRNGRNQEDFDEGWILELAKRQSWKSRPKQWIGLPGWVAIGAWLLFLKMLLKEAKEGSKAQRMGLKRSC